MTRSVGLFVLLLGACAPAPPAKVVLRAGRLIDGSGTPARAAMRVLIHHGAIVAVEPDEGPIDAEALVIDARQLTVLPGLVDAHTHLFSGGACTPSISVGPAQALDNLAALLRGGVTTVADLSAPASMALALRHHVGTARHRGPRLFVAGPMLTAAGGYPLDMFGREAVANGMAVEIETSIAGQTTVRQLAAAGVDLIKVGLQETGYNGRPLPLMRPEVLAAIVDEAHQQELRVVAHAISIRGYEMALDADVDLLAHGLLESLEPALVERLRASGALVMPTMQVFAAPLGGATLRDRLVDPKEAVALSNAARADLNRYVEEDAHGAKLLPPFLLPGIARARAAEGVRQGRTNIAQLYAAGVPLGLGTDSGSCLNPHGSPLRELERLADAGVAPLAIMEIASRGGARALNLHDALGMVRAGYRADLIAVEGNPDEKLEALARVRLVMIDGVVQELEGPSWWAHILGLLRMIWAYL